MGLLYSFYGDDFTGSTDVLQQLASHGVPTVLFLRMPSPGEIARFGAVRAIGLAGDSRSRTPQWMTSYLPGIFERLRALRAPVCHYKVCSTFDSSPETGSIGRAIEIGLEVFRETPFVPIVVAAPHLRRYVAFGNLFAATPDGDVVRIDRHPMSRHPITPMRDADLRTHLRLQTALPVNLVDLSVLEKEGPLPIPRQGSVVLFDGVDARTQASVGQAVWRAAREHTVFSASSSGLTSALVQAWRAEGIVDTTEVARESIPERSPLLVVSGSCSVATERQIRRALESGFDGLAVDARALLHPESAPGYRHTLVQRTAEALLGGRSPLLYTSLGSTEGDPAHGTALGHALGELLRELLVRTGVRRVLLCGGDTCSHAVQQLNLVALTWMADIWPGAPLCRAHSDDPRTDGLELVLKGGQVGDADLFERVLNAHRI